jgi:hypothetical protein
LIGLYITGFGSLSSIKVDLDQKYGEFSAYKDIYIYWDTFVSFKLLNLTIVACPVHETEAPTLTLNNCRTQDFPLNKEVSHNAV